MCLYIAEKGHSMGGLSFMMELDQNLLFFFFVDST